MRQREREKALRVYFKWSYRLLNFEKSNIFHFCQNMKSWQNLRTEETINISVN